MWNKIEIEMKYAVSRLFQNNFICFARLVPSINWVDRVGSGNASLNLRFFLTPPAQHLIIKMIKYTLGDEVSS